MAFDATSRDAARDSQTLARLFTEARTYNDFSDRPVPEATLRRLYDLVKFGPTAANTTPARFLFLTSPEAKARLAPHMSDTNRAKTLKAPVNVVVGYDLEFHEHLPFLFPHNPTAKTWFADIDARRGSAGLNAALQGGYLLIAARALGLDVGPMAGFDAAGVKAEFLADSAWQPTFVVNLGYGTEVNLFPRAPRLAFEDAAKIL